LFAAAERLISMHPGIKHCPRPGQSVLGHPSASITATSLPPDQSPCSTSG